ncbi:hypothetical protein RUM44_003221 [Polyplax serrata]|uniref:Contactin-associated protein-like 2 n=1 Tax=Polyplax serrata TaxID=468196 RepID=A0ABR1AXW5_POLSC
MDDRCLQQVDMGTCESYVHKWYFNSHLGKCDVFVYGGCGGTENRFDSKFECQYACLGPPHTLPPYLIKNDEKIHDSTMSTLSLTSTSMRDTDEEQVVTPMPKCEQPPDSGSCQSFVHKWFFNRQIERCETFVYGGCEGNQNRFDSEYECKLSCLNESHTSLPTFVLKKLGWDLSKSKETISLQVFKFPETSSQRMGSHAYPTVKVDASTSRCQLGIDHGTCRSFVHKWHYNKTSNSCDTFVYGGCQGNANRFDSEYECLHACATLGGQTVTQPHDERNGQREDERTDRTTTEPSSDKKHQKARLDICKIKPYKGACKNFVHKWYFNSSEGECRTFVYGGCMGNANRFDSRAECMHVCLGGHSYTLPPYLSTRTKGRLWDNQWINGSLVKTGPTKPSLPISERDQELTFRDTGYLTTFMFARSNAFIQLDSNQIPTFQLRLCREISFQFRTKLPHGLLVYHSIKDRPESLNPYALYVIVEKGQLKVVHVFGEHSTSVIVGEGLNRDTWHFVTVRIDVHNARLVAKVNGKTAETNIQGLHPYNNYGVTSDLTSVVLIGGLSPEEKLHGVKYIIESFVGCIKDVVLSAGKAALELLPIKPLIATKHENVREGCTDKCRTRANLCFVGSRCVNHYNDLTCDCFGTHYEGEHCDVYTATVLTLRGSSYVSYRVYDWKDRVHSSVNRISLFFKTRYDDSALFYASGEYEDKSHHIAASIKNGFVVLDIDFGDGAIVSTLGNGVNKNYWNNLTIFHKEQEVLVSLNEEVKLLDAPGSLHHLYIDPEIYIGGGPELAKKKGLVSSNNFAGSLKYVYFNEISIIYELKKGNPKVHYIGMLDPEFYDADVEVIPITFPFPSSHIWWDNSRTESLNISFDFKSARSIGVLAYCDVSTITGHGYWLLRVVNDEVRFELVPDLSKNVTHLTTIKFDSRGSWHVVALSYYKGNLKLSVDFKEKKSQLYSMRFRLGDKIIIGSGGKTNIGLVGCMRLIYVNGEFIEPRYVTRTKHAVGDVSLDNCQLVDPCKRPDACEHGGKCSVDVDKVVCDCIGTGYIGKNCHFAEFRKTCEELALLGYTKPDVYLIDIDGNGRFPPAHVKCEFPSSEDSTKTIVEHNLPSQVDVRSSAESDFSFSIKYREFTAEMLQELISHSLYCSQHIKYDCYKAPLDLHSATWFVSSAKNETVDFIGNVKRGSCPCGVNRTCVNPLQSCNCDYISEAKWHSDEGHYMTPNSLGITQMVFLQQKDLAADALGRITLGPLECVETNTQKYVVTFTTSQSYIEVPGWRKGDIAFSFRTTGEKAILLYQPPIRPHYPSFMVALTNDFQLTFNFTLNTGKSRELEIKSRRKLNGGEWQKIWIDYNEHHVRFMINTDYQMVDLLPEEEFGPFEGSMFIGGATQDLLRKSSVTQGLIGCFRGLVVNGEILDIYSYMSVHLSEIIKDCKPTCDPNPCKNGAKCKELWSKYECVCENRWAHIGEHCETNINTKALTFLREESFLKKNYIRNIPNDVADILRNLARQNILVNLRTYDQNSLVLYVNDNLNNFIQLYVDGGMYVVFKFNDGNEIKTLRIQDPGVSSGKSVQVAVIRNETMTTLHVNDQQVSVESSHRALAVYSNRPWINPDKEILVPQRPPAPPTEYYQINLGGYDPLTLIAARAPLLAGYVGCIRGLQIGDYAVDFESLVTESGKRGMAIGCQMKCDKEPCKHQGICMEDFEKGESSCNCEHTSYTGEFCSEEKGADFSGESLLQRQFVLEDQVKTIKVQLAFSSSDPRQRNTVLLLVQTEKKSYYLLVGLTSEGQLIFEEERDGSAYGARIIDRNFLNGARHSIYYQRKNDEAVLLIDREVVPLGLIPVLSITEHTEYFNSTNEVQIGGLNTTDPRFVSYKSYSGCLSNVLVDVNGQEMKPLEEYMLFTKTGSEKVQVANSQGIRTAQCAVFDVVNKPRPGPSLNISLGTDKTWVEDPPARIPYKSLYSDSSTREEGAGKVVFIVLASIFVVILLAAIYELWRTDRKYRRRKELTEKTKRIWSHTQHVAYSEPQVKVVSFRKASISKTVKNGTDRTLIKNEYVAIPSCATVPAIEIVETDKTLKSLEGGTLTVVDSGQGSRDMEVSAMFPVKVEDEIENATEASVVVKEDQVFETKLIENGKAAFNVFGGDAQPAVPCG